MVRDNFSYIFLILICKFLVRSKEQIRTISWRAAQRRIYIRVKSRLQGGVNPKDRMGDDR
jgi:hypothetical protein